MAAARVVLNRRFIPLLAQDIDRRMGRAVHTLHEIHKRKLSTPYPPASLPGTPPHRRTGGLRQSAFAKRLRQMDWAFGFRKVRPARPGSDRQLLGLWMELGTGMHRTPFAAGTQSILPPAGSSINTAVTGTKTSVRPRPSLLPTLMEDGPRIIRFYFRR